MTVTIGVKPVVVPTTCLVALPSMISFANIASKISIDEAVVVDKVNDPKLSEKVRVLDINVIPDVKISMRRKNEHKEDDGETSYLLMHYLVLNIFNYEHNFWYIFLLTYSDELVFENEESMNSFSNFLSTI